MARMNRKRTIIRGDSKVEVIYRPVNIPKRGKQNKKAVKEYVVLSREEKQRKISERKKIKAENKRRKKLGENKLRKLIDTEISEAIEAVIDDAESLMPEKMTQSWSREKRIAEGKWLRIEIRKWMHENDCEEIADLKCSPEIISTLALLRVKLKQDYYPEFDSNRHILITPTG
jgi:hypothetical protein